MRLFKRKEKDKLKNEKVKLPKITKIVKPGEKSGEKFEIKYEEGAIIEFIAPIGVDTGVVSTIYETKRGDIYEIHALVDFKNKSVVNINGKILKYGPFLKRLPGKIFICACSLVIGEILIYYFAVGKIIYYIMGIIGSQLLYEILIRITNKRYEKSSQIEIVKRV